MSEHEPQASGPKLRGDAGRLRAEYFDVWLDVEMALDILITKYCAVHPERELFMMGGVLGKVGARAKVELAVAIAKGAGADHKTLGRALGDAIKVRNQLAHKMTPLALRDQGPPGAVAVMSATADDLSVEWIDADEAMRKVRTALDAIGRLTWAQAMGQGLGSPSAVGVEDEGLGQAPAAEATALDDGPDR